MPSGKYSFTYDGVLQDEQFQNVSGSRMDMLSYLPALHGDFYLSKLSDRNRRADAKPGDYDFKLHYLGEKTPLLDIKDVKVAKLVETSYNNLPPLHFVERCT